MTPPRHLAVIGAGWAGLAAAVAAVQQGWQVTVFEMAPQAGGRARSVALPGRADRLALDNGQHILIGAYTRTLALMRAVGVEPDQVLRRLPLAMVYPDGRGLQLPAGKSALPALWQGVWAIKGWRLGDKLGLLGAAARWALRGFACPRDWTVADLCRHLGEPVRRDLIDPLCVAALNTPADQASARVFLRVLRDALFAGRGSSDLLLPRAGLSALLPEAAQAWLEARGAQLLLGRRVQRLNADGGRWQVDGQAADAVVLACSAHEAARLAQALSPSWADGARTMRHEPIVTAYLHDARLRLPHPMTALHADAHAPAQFVFDLGALGRAPGLFAFVVSGAAPWLQQGLAETGQAVLAQARQCFSGHFDSPAALVHLAAERRATFACTPGLRRPPAQVVPGLVAAGDYVDGPYPATLEGAVMSGRAAIGLLA